MNKNHYNIIIIVLGLFLSLPASGQDFVSNAWVSDLGNGHYRNPIIHADYSDPDICKVDDDFYMTSSSFNAVPGLPILHSRDLVNWRLINHAIPEFPDNYFDKVQHGNGVWAPCIRYHEGLFYIYWGDPDRGIYMVHTEDPAGEWSAPVLVKKAYGNIDPSPLWDDDGKVYLVHAFAHSRAGVKSILQVVELSEDGSEIMDKGTIVYDGHKDHPTIEGPKFYKRGDYYYIFAPAGGVSTGWQLVLRSRHIYGPYEEKIVLAQGDTPINGPHQGGLVELDNGESWFVHFQDKGAYGRIVHLQPVEWIDDWPVMGNDKDGDGTGEPYLTYKKPGLPEVSAHTPPDTDEFNNKNLGLQWQWQANPKPGWYTLNPQAGSIQLNTQPLSAGSTNLWMSPNLLLQKFPAETFKAVARVDVSNLKEGEEAGLIIFGLDYASLAIQKKNGEFEISQRICKDALNNLPEKINEFEILENPNVWLRAEIAPGAQVSFSYSINAKDYHPLGETFQAKEGRWVGAKTGLYAKRSNATGISGYALIDWFHIAK